MISIVMPLYNSERFLADAIDSVLNQSFSDWELLICDDGSQTIHLDWHPNIQKDADSFAKK